MLIDLKHASSLRLWLQCPHTPVRTLTAVYRLAVISTFRADRSAGCCRTLCSDCDRTDEVQLSNVYLISVQQLNESEKALHTFSLWENISESSN